MQNKTLSKVTKPTPLRNRIRSISGLVTGLVGLTNMLTIILPRPNWDMLLGEWSVDTYYGMHKLLVVIGFFLVMLSYGVMRGKRQAWVATVILLLLSGFLYMLSRGQLFVTALTVVLVLLLIAFARHFQARSDPPTIRRGYISLLAGLGIVVLYTIGGFFVLYDQFESLIDRFGSAEVLLQLFTNSYLLQLPHGTQAFFFGHALPILCLSAVLYGIVLILRPVAVALLPNDQERQTAAAFTRMYGTNTISYFAVEAGKSFFFSNSGKSFISYVLEGNVAVVAGDPIGPEEEMLSVISQFISFCHEQDWTIVFWQVRDVYTELYRQAGMHLLKIGEDPVITTDTFTLVGKAMANVRTSARHAEKVGLHVVFYRGQVQDAKQLAQMKQISHTWLASKGGSEMGFSMGRFDVHGDDEQVYALAVDVDNNVYGFVSFVPIYGRKGWGIDLMRRTASVPTGTMELLIVRSIEHLKAGGSEIVSLGLAPLSNIKHSDETFLEYGIDFLSNFVGDLSKKASLCNFKKKFQPGWESRYLVYSSTLKLPKASWALYRAHQRDTSVYSITYRALNKWRAVRHEMQQKSRMVELPNSAQ
ncbi:MAG: phosphatidylglycerol lysyltransferase domain-containing protein [Chloroflexota bacterium]|nr:phosphatidylglycerol lysyltransferase domain-containing protein [Chloroflexota bacterium]